VSFNHHQLIARIGNEQGAREEFARLTAALAELTTRVRRIRENPGDWGIDAFAGRLDDGGEAAVWQAKFFINGVKEADFGQLYLEYRPATPDDELFVEDLAATMLVNSRVAAGAATSVYRHGAAIDLRSLADKALEETTEEERQQVADLPSAR
jgi:hypothetical protein